METTVKPELQRFTPTDSYDDMAAAMAVDGAIIVENVLDPETLEAFNCDIDQAFDDQTHTADYFHERISNFFGPETSHVVGLAAKSERFLDEVLTHPVFMEICDRVLGPHCDHYQLNFADVIQRGPGSKPQHLHRDDFVWYDFPRPLPYQLMLSTLIGLRDFTPEAGSTMIAPGSHLWDLDRKAQPHELVAADMPAGSAVIYYGSVIHAGGENATADKQRRGMHMSYCLGWLRTEENHALTIPLDEVRGKSRQVQTLLGYALHDRVEQRGGYLGGVNWLNPLDLIADGKL